MLGRWSIGAWKIPLEFVVQNRGKCRNRGFGDRRETNPGLRHPGKLSSGAFVAARALGDEQADRRRDLGPLPLVRVACAMSEPAQQRVGLFEAERCGDKPAFLAELAEWQQLAPPRYPLTSVQSRNWGQSGIL